MILDFDWPQESHQRAPLSQGRFENQFESIKNLPVMVAEALINSST